MIVLNNSSYTIQALLGGAVATLQPHCVCTWADITTTAMTPGLTMVATNSATPVTIVGSPAPSTQRAVKSILIKNRDTASVTVTVRINDGAGTFDIVKVALGIDERLEYIDGEGWSAFTATGAIKSAAVYGTPTINQLTAVVLGANVINNNAVANTLQDVTGMLFAVTAGQTYYFKFFIPYSANATTTGSRWVLSGPGITALNGRSRYTLTATTQTQNFFTAYAIPAASNASSLTVGNTAVVEGFITPSASGNVQLQFASEVAGAAVTALAGGLLTWMRVL